MRKLAPMILISSIAFAGAAFAHDTATDKNGQPTVSANTPNPQGTSYSDKSSIAKGTNAPMTDADKAKAEADHDKMKAKKKHMARKDKSMPADTTTMGTTSTAPAPAQTSEGVTAGSTGAIRDNSTTGKTGQ